MAEPGQTAVASEDTNVKDLMTKEKSFMFEERLAAATELRQLGNDRFKRGHMQQAAEAYERALYHVDFDELQVNFDFNDKHREQLTATKLPILLNLCMCLAKTAGGSATSAERATEAIKLDRTCAKAWFWRGKAKMDAGDLVGSAKDLEEAEKLAPGDKAVRMALKSLRIKSKEHASATQKLWRGLFKGSEDKALPAPGKRQLEAARARARGDTTPDGDGGRGRWRKWGEGWGGLILSAVAGAVVIVVWGLRGSSSAAKLAPERP